MDRYKFSGEHADSKTSNRILNTTFYPKIEASNTDLYIISRDGDRIDTLANQYYKDISKWWIIASANNIGKGTMEIPTGIQLRIPMDIPKYVSQLEQMQKG
tara:strand:- start:67 stop:369 length:303 start_codon:yes stop_codon:yes gene_type:complete